VKGGNLYKNAFDHDEHRLLSQVITKKLSRRKWLLTYDNVPLIEELYQKFDTQPYSLIYVANEKKLGNELMVFSPSINVPHRHILRPVKIELVSGRKTRLSYTLCLTIENNKLLFARTGFWQ
jgi:hypothetical protein